MRKTWISWNASREDRLGELRLIIQEKTNLPRDLLVAFHFLQKSWERAFLQGHIKGEWL